MHAGGGWCACCAERVADACSARFARFRLEMRVFLLFSRPSLDCNKHQLKRRSRWKVMIILRFCQNVEKATSFPSKFECITLQRAELFQKFFFLRLCSVFSTFFCCWISLNGREVEELHYFVRFDVFSKAWKNLAKKNPPAFARGRRQKWLWNQSWKFLIPIKYRNCNFFSRS